MVIIGVGSPHDDGEVELLAMITARFPDYRIWRASTPGRRQYVGQAVNLVVHPHTLVTSSLAELHAELSSAQAGIASQGR